MSEIKKEESAVDDVKNIVDEHGSATKEEDKKKELESEHHTPSSIASNKIENETEKEWKVSNLDNESVRVKLEPETENVVEEVKQVTPTDNEDTVSKITGGKEDFIIITASKEEDIVTANNVQKSDQVPVLKKEEMTSDVTNSNIGEVYEMASDSTDKDAISDVTDSDIYKSSEISSVPDSDRFSDFSDLSEVPLPNDKDDFIAEKSEEDKPCTAKGKTVKKSMYNQSDINDLQYNINSDKKVLKSLETEVQNLYKENVWYSEFYVSLLTTFADYFKEACKVKETVKFMVRESEANKWLPLVTEVIRNLQYNKTEKHVMPSSISILAALQNMAYLPRGRKFILSNLFKRNVQKLLYILNKTKLQDKLVIYESHEDKITKTILRIMRNLCLCTSGMQFVQSHAIVQEVIFRCLHGMSLNSVKIAALQVLTAMTQEAEDDQVIRKILLTIDVQDVETLRLSTDVKLKEAAQNAVDNLRAMCERFRIHFGTATRNMVTPSLT